MADISEPASTLLKDGFVASAIAGVAYVLARTGESWWRLFVFALTLSVAWTYIVSGQVVRRGVPIRGAIFWYYIWALCFAGSSVLVGLLVARVLH